MRIILASQSLLRRRALDVLGLKYEVIPSNIDEKAIRHENPAEMALRLSEAKAKACKQKDAVIIAGDAFVVLKNKILEKPADNEEARQMLKSLSAQTFEFITGLAVYNSKTEKLLSTVGTCKIRFRELSDYEINYYISKYPVTKYAGAFEADGMLRFSEYVQGSYNADSAFPVDKLVIFLRENGILV